MFLLAYLFSILFLNDPSTIEGTELTNNTQTELEVNLVDQCMANPETGPQGRYHSAMRFKFVLDGDQQYCAGSILLCYPGQLDPDKTIGLSVPTTHWTIPNLDNNRIVDKCNEIRKTCYRKAECEMQDTPWHGIQIKIGKDGQIKFKMSTGESYKFPLTNFTLMLHNNEVHDKADPVAFLVNDYDNQDLCIEQNAFPIAGQSKPVVIKIPLSGNDDDYREWKKLDKVGQQGKLRNHTHLFRLSWDMLPKTQLNEDDEKMYIWMVNDVNATCNTRVFFLNRMQREAENFAICPHTAVTEIPLSDQCPSSGWKPIKAAYLADDYGSELVVRVGFLSTTNKSNEKDRMKDEEEWIQLRRNLSTSPMMKQKVPSKLKEFVEEFDYGQYRYASLQNDFEMDLSADQQLEALVFVCPVGIITTLVRHAKFSSLKNFRVEHIYDWSQDFNYVNQCNETRHLLIRQTVEIKNATDKIKLKAHGLEMGIIGYEQAKEQANDDVKMRNSKFKIDVKAHHYKFNGRITNVESANNYNRVRKFGRIVSIHPDIYVYQKFTTITAVLKIKNDKMLRNYASRRDKTSVVLTKNSCAETNYCKRQPMRDFCEEQNAIYECATCTKDNCNGVDSRWESSRICKKNNLYKNDSSIFDAFQVVESTNGTLNISDELCGDKFGACLTEICITKNDTVLISLGCAKSFYCNSKESENVQSECKKDYRCHLCNTKDRCNDPMEQRSLPLAPSDSELDLQKLFPARKCLNSFNEYGDANIQPGKVGQKGALDCSPDHNRCLTEICYATDEKTTIIKGCAHSDYCNSNISQKIRTSCEDQDGGHYECKLCHGLDNCNGLPFQKCWNSIGGPFGNGFLPAKHDKDEIGMKDFECPNLNMSSCATEKCKKPSEFMVFGLYVLHYECPNNISFFLPRFDGAILNGTEPEHRTHPERIEGNMVKKFRVHHVYYQEEQKRNITVNRNNLAECFYDLDNKHWKDCTKWKTIV